MSDLIYHGLFIVSQVFQIVLCVDALYQRNTGKKKNVLGAAIRRPTDKAVFAHNWWIRHGKV
jgi:hypothetical protein